MHVFTKTEDLKKHLTKEGKTIGFVPTMGALHVGHISLVNTSLTENEITVVSIFVNPTQFNNVTDLDKYPRTINDDVALLEGASRDIVVFAPSVEDIYGEKSVSMNFDFHGLENQMEGKFRKGHFNGVGTVITLLFEAVKPTRAYFGEKDFQQLQIIKKLVEINDLPVEIIGCAIHRELDGLAFSSRNSRLTAEQHAEAKFIYEVLSDVKKMFGTKNVHELNEMVSNKFKNHSLFELEYFEIADIENLETVREVKKDKKYRAFLAVFAGEVRLIDNIALN